ncbi:DUF2752 domain-containing protein [Candidatus Weimeria sp. HCP3S3_B5]|uniref:DUF2752 domain-containing protein n=1 Tax=Candidatus Weimeria sp. HCP3S3_B5 TaxID=3438871 RepID=UPI003F8C4110
MRAAFLCIFHEVTGLYCPGCGGTRALRFLLHGHPLLSLWYHPLVIYGVFLIIYYCIRAVTALIAKENSSSGSGGAVVRAIALLDRKQKLHRDAPLWGALVLLVINCILKNAILLIAGVDPLP